MSKINPPKPETGVDWGRLSWEVGGGASLGVGFIVAVALLGMHTWFWECVPVGIGLYLLREAIHEIRAYVRRKRNRHV